MQPAQQVLSLSRKSAIRTLCLQHGIDLLRLSQESSIEPLIIWDLFVGNPQPEHVKALALATINRIAGTHYTDGGT